ncbi:MAG: TetR/AcrR family transcriptional regulator, partial [Pseudomonadota bacterium]
ITCDMKSKDPKKAQILDSAIRVFSGKGYLDATISEIAKGAGVTDPAVYKYFKGKEDVLFKIPEENMRIFLENIPVQLEGTKGADNKLRKIIWYHARYFTTKPEYTIILLLECRPNPRFYKSKAYQLIKVYSRIIIDIIKEGVSEGVFRDLPWPQLLRDMVMGALDHLALNWIMRDGPNPLEKAENICDLVLNAALAGPEPSGRTDPKEDKRNKILSAAAKVFTEKSYNDATISELAREAGVAEGTIYEYYKNKEDLLINTPEKKLEEMARYIRGESPEHELKKIIMALFRFFNNNQDYAAILVLMLRPNRKFYQSRSQAHLDDICEVFKNIIIKGQKQGSFLDTIDIHVFQCLVLGAIDHIFMPWLIFQRQYDLIKVGEEACQLFIDAIST